MPRVNAITLSPVPTDVDYISTTESLTTPWALQLDGVLDLSANPQHVTITTTSDEQLAVFTVTGTDRHGNVMTEAITGPNATTVVGAKNFATITSIVSTLDATGVTAGVDGTCESGWFPINYRGPDFNIGFGAEITGACTYTVQHTFNDVQITGFVEDDATVFNHDSVAAKTANEDGNYINPPVACRLAITAHTSGDAILRIVEGGR